MGIVYDVFCLDDCCSFCNKVFVYSLLVRLGFEGRFYIMIEKKFVYKNELHFVSWSKDKHHFCFFLPKTYFLYFVLNY